MNIFRVYMIYTDDQDPHPGDLVVLEDCQGKVFCTIDDPDAWRAKTKGPGLNEKNQG
jgi:hypothetical protein